MAICSTHNVLKDRDIYFLNREIFQIRYFLVAFCVNNFPFLPNDKLLNDDRVMKILKIISYRWNDYKQLEYKHELRKKKKGSDTHRPKMYVANFSQIDRYIRFHEKNFRNQSSCWYVCYVSIPISFWKKKTKHDNLFSQELLVVLQDIGLLVTVNLLNNRRRRIFQQTFHSYIKYLRKKMISEFSIIKMTLT